MYCGDTVDLNQNCLNR